MEVLSDALIPITAMRHKCPPVFVVQRVSQSLQSKPMQVSIHMVIKKVLASLEKFLTP
jgi:hypothetical protein